MGSGGALWDEYESICFFDFGCVYMGIISEKSLISTQVLVYGYTLVFAYFVCFISQ